MVIPTGGTVLTHSNVCTLSPWHDHILTHLSLSRLTLIISNHELPHWSFPEMAYLPANHHLRHGSEPSSGFISPIKMAPQDLGAHCLGLPPIFPSSPHLYVDLESQRVNYILIQD